MAKKKLNLGCGTGINEGGTNLYDHRKQTDFGDIKEAGYGSPYDWANAILIGVIKN